MLGTSQWGASDLSEKTEEQLLKQIFFLYVVFKIIAGVSFFKQRS